MILFLTNETCKNSWKVGFVVSKLVVGDESCKFEVSWNQNVAFFRNFWPHCGGLLGVGVLAITKSALRFG